MEPKHVLTTSSDLAASPLGSPHCPHGRVQHFRNEAVGTPLDLPVASSTSPASLLPPAGSFESPQTIAQPQGAVRRGDGKRGRFAGLEAGMVGRGMLNTLRTQRNAISGDREQVWLSPLAGPDGFFPKTSL